jgi:hypothetical protein
MGPRASAATAASPAGVQASTLADLTCCTRRTTGEVPPPLVRRPFPQPLLSSISCEHARSWLNLLLVQVGASTTVIGSHLYLFGGRLVPTRTMINDLYRLDLNTLVWKKLWPSSSASPPIARELSTPQPRYFHSAEAWGTNLLIFGGMGYVVPLQPQSPTETQDTEPADIESGLCVLSDLIVYDTVAGSWLSPLTSNSAPTQPSPSARYAHLSCITNNSLVILGGQDISNHYLQEVNVLDLERMVWAEPKPWTGNFGTYRSVAVSRNISVHTPPARPGRSRRSSLVDPKAGPGDTDQEDNTTMATIQLPYSAPTVSDQAEPILLYSNFNFSAYAFFVSSASFRTIADPLAWNTA